MKTTTKILKWVLPTAAVYLSLTSFSHNDWTEALAWILLAGYGIREVLTCTHTYGNKCENK